MSSCWLAGAVCAMTSCIAGCLAPVSTGPSYAPTADAPTTSTTQRASTPNRSDPSNPTRDWINAIAHRPAIVLNMQNGPRWKTRYYLNTVADEDGNGVADGFDRFEREKLDHWYERGVRRIVLNRATGDLTIEWTEMTAEQQEGYRRGVGDWATRHPDLSLEVYIRLDGTPREPDPANPNHREAVLRHIRPWLDVGVSVVWIDIGQRGHPMWAWLNESDDLLRPNGERMYVGAEVGGVLLSADGSWPSASVPWIGASRNPMYRAGRVGLYEPIDASDTSVGVWIFNDNIDSIEQVASIVRNGKWVAGHEGGYRYFNRVCGFGEVTMPADFNADGKLTEADRALFLTEYGRGARYGPVTFYTGDYNLDGRIDQDDIRAFERDFAAGGGQPKWLGVSGRPVLLGAGE